MVCQDQWCGIDSETELIQNRHSWPDVVVAGFCSRGHCQLVWWTDLPVYLPQFLALNPYTTLVFLNLAFDFNVMGRSILLEELKKDNRVIELQANYRMSRMAEKGWFPGKNTLESITRETLGVNLDKESGVRTSYTRDMIWTEQHAVYLAEDCAATYRCGKVYSGMPTQDIQARASFVLAEIGFNGMLVDQYFLREQAHKISSEMEELAVTLKGFGYRTKSEVDDMTQRERLIRICKMLYVDEAEQLLPAAEVKQVGRSWWMLAASYVYQALSAPGTTPSDIREMMLTLLNVLRSKPKMNKANRKFFDYATTYLLRVLEKIDCVECMVGLGEAKASSSYPFIVLLEIMAQEFSLGNTLTSMETVHQKFQEEHEENMGWLPTAEKKLSPTKFLQQHLIQLMQQTPALVLPYTDASKENIQAFLKDEKKAAKKEGMEIKVISHHPIYSLQYSTAEEGKPARTVDIRPLEVFQLQACDMWRLSDVNIVDPFLEAYVSYKHREKMLSTYITDKYIEEDGRVHPRFDLMKRTARTGCSGPNLQNLPKENGLREMYIAPKGKVLCSCDYGQEELVTLGATLLWMYGKSRLADAVNKGLDLHSFFSLFREGKVNDLDLDNLDEETCAIIKERSKPYKEVKELKHSRKLSKACNFGFGGGMGVPTFYLNCRRQGFDVTMEECERLREAWFDFYPEMRRYIEPCQDGTVDASVFKKNKKAAGGDDAEDLDLETMEANKTGEYSADVTGKRTKEESNEVPVYRAIAMTGNVRVRTTYSSACNFPFQCLASTCSKNALWKVFLDSIVNDYKIVNFIHLDR